MSVINQEITDRYALYNGDSALVMQDIPENSVDYSIYSPPFSSLYTYSNSLNDLSNCKNHDEFFEHYKYIIRENLRITKPGRLCTVHVTNLSTTKANEGYTGLIDFKGEVIRAYQAEGWIYSAEAVVWKDPRIAAQRTKTQGLLYATFRKDATKCRMGLPDYMITFKKPGENEVPVTHDPDEHDLEYWAELASPVWMTVDSANVLQKVKDDKDERHMTPTQLDVLERGIQLYTNENEVVFSPFNGIGSEGYQALKMNRKYIGIELKSTYFDVAKKNLEQAIQESNQMDIFDMFGDEE